MRSKREAGVRFGLVAASLLLVVGVGRADPPTVDLAKIKAIDSGSWFRSYVACDEDCQRYGLRYAPPTVAQLENPVIVTIHGFNSQSAAAATLVAGLDAERYCCGHFSYPNDQSIEASALHLASQLRATKKTHPSHKFALVTHSMGGIVARRVIEDPALDSGNVTTLIMVAPPNHGSRLAKYAVAVDTWEHWLGRNEGSPWTRWRDSVVDGLGEACNELVPGSAYLKRLNERPRNPEISYTLLLGDDATLTRGEMAWLRSSAKVLERVPGTGESGSRFSQCLNDFDECIDGRGDGVVAIRRGRLDGVDDTVVLPFGHLCLVNADESSQLKVLQREVALRLSNTNLLAKKNRAQQE